MCQHSAFGRLWQDQLLSRRGARRAELQTGYIARGCSMPYSVFAAADVSGADLRSVVEKLLSGT